MAYYAYTQIDVLNIHMHIYIIDNLLICWSSDLFYIYTESLPIRLSALIRDFGVFAQSRSSLRTAQHPSQKVEQGRDTCLSFYVLLTECVDWCPWCSGLWPIWEMWVSFTLWVLETLRLDISPANLDYLLSFLLEKETLFLPGSRKSRIQFSKPLHLLPQCWVPYITFFLQYR